MKLLRTPTTGAHKDLSLQISRGNGVELTIQLPLKTPKLPNNQHN